MKRIKFSILSGVDLILFGIGLGIMIYYALIGRIGEKEQED